MTIETLTDGEREYLRGFRTPESNKALRIIDQLTARVAELEAARQPGKSVFPEVVALREQLAAANALLDEWLTVDAAASNTPQRLLDRVNAHLAGQAAPEPKQSEMTEAEYYAYEPPCGGQVPGREPSRAEAEQRVLDAMGQAPEWALRSKRLAAFEGVGEACAAELARREAAR